MSIPLIFYLATQDNHPYALGGSPEEAQARAEARCRADHAAMVAAALGRGVVDDSEPDLSDIDPEPLPLPWSPARLRTVLGAWWGSEEVVSREMAALEAAA